MAKPNPTNGELAVMMKNIGAQLVRIEAHVKETNGSVKDNTAFILGQRMANKFIYGILTLIFIPVIFLLAQPFI